MRTLLSNRDATDLAQVRRFIVGTLSTDQAENIGETIYVDGTAGSNAFDGKSPDRAKLTITAALAVAVAGDVVAVFPGTYAEHVTMAVANVSLVGLGDVPRQVLLASAAVLATPYITIAATAPGCCVANLRISPGEVTDPSCIHIHAANTLVEQCEFFLGTVPLLIGVEIVGPVATCFHNTIRDCVFDGHTLGIVFTPNVTNADGNLIERCRFVNTVTGDIRDDAGIIAVTLVWIKDCDFLSGTLAGQIRLTSGASTGCVYGCAFNLLVWNGGDVLVDAGVRVIGCYYGAGVNAAQPT